MGLSQKNNHNMDLADMIDEEQLSMEEESESNDTDEKPEK